MIHSATQTAKFKKLVRRLRPHLQGLPVATETLAIGILESMWHLAINSARRGDIGRLDDESIAEALGWFGDPGTLIAMLVETGWLDACETNRLIIHDWDVHCPGFIKRNIARQGGFVRVETSSIGAVKTPLNDSPEYVSDALPTQVSKEGLTPNITQPNPTQPNQPPISPPRGDGPTVREFFDRWNTFAAKTPKVGTCRKLSEPRIKKIRARLAADGWFDDFREAVLSLPLGGDGWQPTLDWLIRNDHNIYLLMEGAFDWRNRDDPAAQKLAMQKRKAAFEQREAEERWKAEQHKKELDGRRKAMADTLPAMNGESVDESAVSLLFGTDDDLSVSGAERCNQ